MKSKLRSRWYRQNEKPLETSSQVPKNLGPFGEIEATGEQLVDDLSDAKPKTQKKKNNQIKKKDKNDFKLERQGVKRVNQNRPGKTKSRSRSANSFEGESNTLENKYSRNNPPRIDKIKDNSHSSNQRPKRKKNKHRSEFRKHQKSIVSQSKNDQKDIKKKNGLSAFISKLFGG